MEADAAVPPARVNNFRSNAALLGMLPAATATGIGSDVQRPLATVADRSVSYRAVRASRGKAIRAEPVAALYEQGRVHHVGLFADLAGCGNTGETSYALMF